ncbi:MAG: hypothetical protein P9L97_01840 [Candidatus Tenebribacter davisii]|jgi:hypothetical protein|nr:hypothetical protein [Candidatus Tenebribacter davisii]
MQYNEGIDLGIKEGQKFDIIARKIYLSYPTKVFKDLHEIEFDVLDAISNFFKIPFTNVQVVGSAKTGYSYYQSKEFVLGGSDLDVAIISSDLFIRYTEMVYDVTRGYTELTGFKDNKSIDEYKYYLLKGMFRPDLMPNIPEKYEWFKFFNGLSKNYYELFNDINAGIYLSQFYFEKKQRKNIINYRNNLGVKK